MGMHKTVYLVAGVRLSDEDLWDLGYIDLQDEDLLPYIEGHEGTEVRVLHGEDFEGCVAGLILAQSGDDTEDECVEVTPDLGAAHAALRAANLLPAGRLPKLLFVDLWW